MHAAQAYDELQDEEVQESSPRLMRSPELDQEIREAVDEVIGYKQERDEINAQIREVVERMETKGLPRAAFKAILKESELTEDQRRAYDTALLVGRSALGIPLQSDLFE